MWTVLIILDLLVSYQAASAADDDDASNEDAFSQSEEWIKFQNSITGDSSQAGQGKKSRGGKKARRKREEELAKLEQDTEDASMRFPALRYSEEETEALLKQAYAALSERTGKRGTRNLWRQKNRWKAVRRIRYKYKQNLIAAHERRMEKRHWKREKVKEMKAGAPKTREKDLDYQAEVLRRWAATMFADVGALSDDVEGTDTETEEEAKVMASTKE